MWHAVTLLLGSGIEAAGLWFVIFLAAIPGAALMMLAAFMVYTVVRLLLRPLVGAASSDMVKGITTKKQGNKEK